MPEHSRPWYPHPRYGRAQAEPGLGDTELAPAPAGDKAMEPHTSPAPLTARPDKEAAAVRAGGERGHTVVPPLPWLIAYTKSEGLSQRHAAQDSSEEAKLERASSTCRHAGGVKVAARNLLAEPR